MNTLKKIIDFEKPIVYIDIEATENNNKPRILQLSALLVKDNKIIKEFNMWSNPETHISEHVLWMLKKRADFFSNKKPNYFVFNEFVNFISGYDQIVCFGNYDQKIIDYQCKINEKKEIKLIDIQNSFYCKFLNNRKISLSLSLLADALSIDNTQKKEHNALLDAKMLFKVVSFSLEIERMENFEKIVYGELISPKKKKYRNMKHSRKVEESFLFSKDNEYVYFYLKINRILKENSLNEKYISSIKFITKKYSSKGVLLNKIDKDIQFKEHEQDIVEKNIEWIFKKFNDIYFKNSIIITRGNFKDFLNYYEKKYKSLPLNYYISYEILSWYVSNVMKEKQKDFINDDDFMSKLISRIRQKWNKTVILQNGVK